MVTGESPDTIRIVQFSDSHLQADPEACLFGVNTLSSLKAVVDHARGANNSLDLALATGDLVHDESEAGYAMFKTILGSLGVPVYCLPGNHDSASVMRHVLAQERVQMVGDIDIGGWCMIFLDTAVPGCVGGHLSEAELARLEACLAAHPGRPILLAMHHPPVTIGTLWMDRIGLDNAAALWRVVDRYPSVRGIVWGHAHQEYDAVWRGVRLLGAPSTCFQFLPRALECTLDPRPAGYRWLRLQPNGAIDTGVIRVDAVPGAVSSRASMDYI